MKYQFVSAIRKGAVALAENSTEGRFTTPVALQLEANEELLEVEGKKLAFWGPGDVLGINPAAIIRTEPAPNVGDFEPNYFPFVEFGEADFLWRYSLSSTISKEVAGTEIEMGIIPWLTLLVLETPQTRDPDDETGEFYYNPLPTEGLPPSISIHSSTVLSDLSRAWRYAHVQLMAQESESAEHAPLEYPDHSLCRLFCPRRLKSETKYTAFIIPTYDVGRLRGLGEEVKYKKDKPFSWKGNKAPDGQKLQMPYYYQWEFHTSARGDFESLVRQLEPRELSTLGTFSVDISQAASDLNAGLEEDSINMEGALTSTDVVYSQWGADHKPPYADSSNSEFRKALAAIITSGIDTPAVAPPLYGTWHQEGSFAQNQGWWRELNLDPRHRYAAGLGDQVIKEHQEAFMAEAWRQLGEIKEANRHISMGRYGSQISKSIYKRLEKMSPAQQLQIFAPVAHQIKAKDEQGNEADLNSLIFNSSWPKGALSTNLRRMLRPRGKLGKKLKGQLPLEVLSDVTTQLTPKEFPQTDQLLATLRESIPSTHHRSLGSSFTPRPALTHFQKRFRANDDTRLPLQQWTAIKPGLVIQQPVPQNQVRRFRNRNLQGQLSGIADLRSWRGRKVRVKGRRNRARINRKGVFRMKLPEGSYSLHIDRTDIEFEVHVKAGLATLLNLELGQLSTLMGQVIGTDQKPLKRGRIIVEGTSQVVPIEDNGQYQLNLPAGSHRLWVQSVGVSQKILIHVQEGEDVLFDLEMDSNSKLNASSLNLERRIFNLEQLEPAKTIGSVLARRFSGLSDGEAGLKPLEYQPKFPYPMAEFLSQDQLFPGLEQVPRNTVAVVKINKRFLEAYMVGLNHAFTGEALWREYPIPLGSTVFQHFWDQDNMQVGSKPDINPIKDAWESSARLGDNAIDKVQNRKETSGEQLVLLLRSDLLRKYPDMNVYLAKVDDTENGMSIFSNLAQSIKPILQGELPPDIAYWGFPKTVNEVINQNYYIIFEEISLNLRLGLDETSMDTDSDGFLDFGMENPGDYLPVDQASWGDMSSAELTVNHFVQKPVRLAISLDKLLPTYATLDQND